MSDPFEARKVDGALRAFSRVEDAIIARALEYPYSRPNWPFIFDRARATPLRGLARFALRAARGGLVEVADRGLFAPVLASGSNASIAALRRKFGTRPVGLIQFPCTLSGAMVAHSAHVARYGAIPATVVHDHARRAHHEREAFVQLVPLSVLPILDGSEALGVNYERVWMDGVRVQIKSARPTPLHSLGRVMAYRSLHGPVVNADQPMELRAQTMIYRMLATRMGWRGTEGDLAHKLARDAQWRARAAELLKSSDERSVDPA